MVGRSTAEVKKGPDKLTEMMTLMMSFNFYQWVHTLAPQVSKAPIHGKGTPLGCPVPMLFPKHLPQPMPKVAAWDTWILLCPDMTFLMQQSRQS